MERIIRTCEELLKEYERTNSSENSSHKLCFSFASERFQGYEKKDVYNITAPFIWEGKTFLAGRVEERDSEHSEVVFFEQKDGAFVPAAEAPVLQLQDPFVTRVNEELIVGGVEIFPDAQNPEALCWRTVFYRGKTLAGLERFAQGPDGMKDIRLRQLADGTILAAVRPQGEKGGRGKIGFLRLHDLSELTEENLENAPVLEGQFVEEEWGGCNEMHLLSDGWVGVLSHIACFDQEGNRHYYATSFTYHVETGICTPMKMLARRSDFAEGESKREDLKDVIFSGGLVRRTDGKAELYCGVGDAEAHKRIIEDPFFGR